MAEIAAGGSSVGNATPGGGGSGTAAPVGGAPPPAAGTPPVSVPGTAQGAPPADQAVATPPGTQVETPKKYRVKIDKQEREVSREEILQALMDEVGEDGVLDIYKLRQGAYKRFEGAKKTDQRLQQAVEMFKAGHKGVGKMLTDLYGQVEGDRILDELFKERETRRKMTPEQRAQHDERTRFQQDKALVARDKAALQQRQERERAIANAQAVEKQFHEVLTSMELPTTKPMVARMAIIARDAAKRGVPMTYQEVAKQVQTDVKTELAAVIKSYASKPERLREYLGEEVIAAIRSMEAERIKGGGPHIIQPRGDDGKFVPVRGNPVVPVPNTPPRKRPIAEVFEEMRRAERGR